MLPSYQETRSVSVKLIPLYATSLKIDVPNNHILYTTDVVAGPGIFLLGDEGTTHDLVFANEVHPGGPEPISCRMKATRIPSRKYEKNERIGFLLTLDLDVEKSQ